MNTTEVTYDMHTQQLVYPDPEYITAHTDGNIERYTALVKRVEANDREKREPLRSKILARAKRWSCNHADPYTGEVNTTLLAEAVAFYYDRDEWLDSETAFIWDAVVIAAADYEKKEAKRIADGGAP
tara:strand:+ start:630 stop:1010 length:381 start_codon:yes stop_codon:yes gene_type:complete